MVILSGIKTLSHKSIWDLSIPAVSILQAKEWNTKNCFRQVVWDLQKAVERFDESRGLKFSTYAVPVILGEIKRIFRDGGSVRVSRTLKELSMKICRLNTEYEKNNGREMSVTELSQALNVSEDKICEALSAGSSPLSLNADYDDEGNSRIDIPVSDSQEEITERLSLNDAIAELDERDRQIIHLRYFQNKTQSQTADCLAMTQVQISRRERKILALIREKNERLALQLSCKL